MKNICYLLLLMLSVNTYAQEAAPQIKTANGTLQGVAEASGIHSFKGIPFAQPPVGDLRWREPQAPKNWEGVRKADHFGPQAMQRYIYNDMMFRSDGKSEDCLYLNVWTPAKSAKEKLPVLVYFYGGGFQAGDGSEYRYDGEALARKGIITLTVNYRLGIFGFMAHPELTKESPNHASGNYGLMDQHAALVWVQKNIAAFGGDPKKVTIGGESAGSMSVCGQVASPLSKGLFIGAIGESGSLLGNLSPMPLATAEQNGVKFGSTVGANSLADLRKIPADKLLELSANSRFGTDIDGYFLPEAPANIFAAGKQMHVNLLAGWNSAEGGDAAVLGKAEPTIANFTAAVQKMYGNQSVEILKVYVPATDADVRQVATELASDRFIAFSTWKFIDMQSKTGGKPVYRYYYTRKRPTTVDGKVNTGIGAVHSAEIEYALGNLSTNKVYAWTADDHQISETMQSYFVNFVKTGNPNGKGLTPWQTFNPGSPNLMVIDVKCQPKVSDTEARYAVLDK
ncbi:carboxylesterase family protein [Mucilaginibacter mali]|uniref:Carboxylic ester hydrolase n=1 Tax=Mucilaginibacter mali TaxID=2740462 RepID=A0A7D4QP15_9SPHI|nr:carboxylesterase family protein [Mucilaginibacter mali]QKJ28289.1 carboxylesterase family protein [Mucilaginibacter mali]